MGKSILLFIILFNINLFPQEQEKSEMFSSFHLGILGGINYTTLTGPSAIMEGSTNLTSNLYFKFSIGYSIIYQNSFQRVKTYEYISFDDVHLFATHDYNINYLKYEVAPISIGLQYFFDYGKFSPYCFLEGGYNSYDTKQDITSDITGLNGDYNTYDELPPAYKNNPPTTSQINSYRVGIGVGTKYRLFKNIDFDIRYLYQVNSNIINTHQILFGFAI